MILTAITGSIGCGKTTVSNVLRKHGFLVYDVDKWVKFLYYKKDFLKVVKYYFPEVFSFDGVFNKRALRNLVFGNPEKLRILEGLIHPFLTAQLRRIVRKRKNRGLVFVDVALLFEMGWDKYFDYIILADVDVEEQRKRVMIRDNITEEDFDKINKLQKPQEEKRKLVDFIVNTKVDENVLTRDLFGIIKELKKCK